MSDLYSKCHAVLKKSNREEITDFIYSVRMCDLSGIDVPQNVIDLAERLRPYGSYKAASPGNLGQRTTPASGSIGHVIAYALIQDRVEKWTEFSKPAAVFPDVFYKEALLNAEKYNLDLSKFPPRVSVRHWIGTRVRQECVSEKDYEALVRHLKRLATTVRATGEKFLDVPATQVDRISFRIADYINTVMRERLGEKWRNVSAPAKARKTTASLDMTLPMACCMHFGVGRLENIYKAIPVYFHALHDTLADVDLTDLSYLEQIDPLRTLFPDVKYEPISINSKPISKRSLRNVT